MILEDGPGREAACQIQRTGNILREGLVGRATTCQWPSRTSPNGSLRQAPVSQNRAAILPRFRASFTVGLTLVVALFGFGGSLSAANKPLLVHYMPWFVAKPYSPNWGWHWTMNHFNPDTTNGLGRRQIASWFYPQIGPYDSADPVVLEYHVLLMKLAGIQGVIVDWYGKDAFNDYRLIDQRTTELLKFTRKAELQFCLCYEDRTIQAQINAGRISAKDALARAQETMLYAQSNYFNNPGYLRLANQTPVLLNFGPNYFTNSDQWTAIFSVLEASNRPSFFTLNHRLSAADGAFNWPPMYLSRTNHGILLPGALKGYLDSSEQRGAAWPAFISSAFPRFHDIYEQAGMGFSYGSLDDCGGLTLRNTLERALTNSAAIIQLVTWNDYGEGTVIEPTLEHGCRDLGTIQDLRRRYLTPDIPYRTNDFKLATQLYNLRRQQATNSTLAAELDRAFAEIVWGNLKLAEARLISQSALECRVAPAPQDW